MKRTTKVIIANNLLTFLVLLTLAAFSLGLFYAADLRHEQYDLEKGLRTFWELYRNKGAEFSLANGQLLVGTHVINGNFEVPDKVQGIFGGVATVFMGDVRVATNVLDESGKRAVGTRLAGPAYSAIFNEGRSYRGEALILGHTYLTAYDPIRNHKGEIIGALFVGLEKTSFLKHFTGIKCMTILMLLVLLAGQAIASLLLMRMTRRFENAEANSLSFLETLIDTIPSPIFYKDAEGRFLGVNRAYEVYMGMPRGQLIGKTIFDLWPEDLAECYHRQDQALFESPGTQMYEASLVPADGTRHSVIFHKATFHSQNGTVKGLVGVILDITERKAAEEEIKNANQKLHDIIEFLPDATFVVGKDKRVIAWNLAMEKMTGIGKEEMLGKGDYAIPFYGERRPILIDLIDAEGKDHLYPEVKRVGRTLFTETWIPGFGGRKDACMWGTAAPLFDKQGNRVGGIESIRDITEYKQIESELRFRNLLQSTQLEASLDGIITVDEKDRILFYNRRFAEITHLSPCLLDEGDWLALRAAIMECAEDPHAFIESVRQIYENQKDASREEIALKGGVIIDRYSVPMIDDEGRYHGRVWFFRDITRRKQAEEMRLRFEAQRHHSEMMEAFITQLGHDLRTPLTPLFALLPLIGEKNTDSSLKRMIEICKQNVDTMHALVEKALKLVSLSASAKGLLAHVNLSEVAERCLHDHREILDQREIVCENDIDPGIVVIAMPDQLKELFNNLISNAVHYSDSGGIIRFAARQTAEAVTVEVHDNGIGVDSADLEHIFEEFFKADASRHDLDSPGLGLAICRRIIDNHHGTIRAESLGKGRGMTVTFTLPTHNYYGEEAIPWIAA